MKTGLVLEGGALRTIFSSGVCDALLDKGLPLPDYTVGVSAGVSVGAGGVSGVPGFTAGTLGSVAAAAAGPFRMTLFRAL